MTAEFDLNQFGAVWGERLHAFQQVRRRPLSRSGEAQLLCRLAVLVGLQPGLPQQISLVQLLQEQHAHEAPPSLRQMLLNGFPEAVPLGEAERHYLGVGQEA